MARRGIVGRWRCLGGRWWSSLGGSGGILAIGRWGQQPRPPPFGAIGRHNIPTRAVSSGIRGAGARQASSRVSQVVAVVVPQHALSSYLPGGRAVVVVVVAVSSMSEE